MRPLVACIALLTVAAGPPPMEPGLHVEIVGTIHVEHRDFGYAVGRAYWLRDYSEERRIPLLVRREGQAAALDRLAASGARAHVEGTWVEVGRRGFLSVESIAEIEAGKKEGP